MKKAVIIFDIDGTLADNSHRQHFLSGEKKDWDGFYSCIEKDKPIEEMKWLFQALGSQIVDYHVIYREKHLSDMGIVIVTGRPDSLRAKTEAWLNKYIVPDWLDDFVQLYMRKEGDHRPDWQIKQEILNEIQEDGSKVIMAIDDRKQVVDMWRKNGIRCLQCAEGNF